MSTIPERPQDGTVPISRPPAWTAAGGDPVPTNIGDFEIVSKLGEGSFGQVFLARQKSLGRLVALKVMRGKRDIGTEGQVLAGLEHDHIVKVFSTFADPEADARGLCLQYVPGADLGVIIRRVFEDGRTPESGTALLAALDAARRGDPGFDPAALRDRESLAGDDFAQAVCRVGGKLAEALAFAHARGILHCDIKPGNILLTPYGRPMLADFNVAFDQSRHTDGDTHYGGTLAYMAPEYRAAVFGDPGGSADERCDIYSLGVVLHELATGKRPEQPLSITQTAETAQQGAPTTTATPEASEPDQLAGVPRELAAIIRRCLEPDPAKRYQTAAELAAALSGAWSLLAARRALPAPGRIGRWVMVHPALALVLAGSLPHLAASIAQIEYNTAQVRLNDAHQRAFVVLVIVYNLIAYPVGIAAGVYLIGGVARKLARLPELSGREVDALRRRARRLAPRIAVLGAVGWLPGGLIFPLVIDLATEGLPWQEYAHFVISFTLAGLIGVVFSYLSIQFVVFRTLLPRLGNPDTHTPAGMWAEVRPMTTRFDLLVMLACAVPLLGAVLLLTLEDGAMSFSFRLLVVKLIGLGVAGVALAERVVRTLRQLAGVWQVEGEGNR